MVTIALFDENKEARERIKTILQAGSRFQLIGVFESGSNLMDDIERTSPDIVIMDIEMRGFDGSDLIGKLKQAHPDIQVLIQTDFQDARHVYRAIAAGASGYITKSRLASSLVPSLDELCTGGAPLSPAVARQVLGFLRDDNRKLQKALKDYQLTPREKDVMSCLVEGLSYKMIAAKLYISTETVRSHVKNIYTKLKVESLTGIVALTLTQNLLN